MNRIPGILSGTFLVVLVSSCRVKLPPPLVTVCTPYKVKLESMAVAIKVMEEDIERGYADIDLVKQFIEHYKGVLACHNNATDKASDRALEAADILVSGDDYKRLYKYTSDLRKKALNK